MEKVKIEEILFIVYLKYSLLSVIQICDKDNDFIFKKHCCEIRRANSGKLVVHSTRTSNNLYTLVKNTKDSCLLEQEDVNWLWHKRLGHFNFEKLVKIISRKVVRDITCISNISNHICPSCQKGKEIRYFKVKDYYTSKSLELVYTNLYGPTRIQIINYHRYFILCIDDFSRNTWV